MDEKKIKTERVLNDLIKLNILKYNAPDYRMDNPFEALYSLVSICEKKR